MKIHNVTQGTREWFAARKGRISSSKVKSLMVKPRKAGAKPAAYWELVAERAGLIEMDEEEYYIYGMENAAARGKRLEPGAVAEFERQTGKRGDRVGFVTRDDYDGIALSPDLLVPTKSGVYTLGVEVKCLSHGNHMEVWMTGEIPAEYRQQIVQYFVVVPTLKRLVVFFYDPDFVEEKYRTRALTIRRADVAAEAAESLATQIAILEEVDLTLARK